MSCSSSITLRSSFYTLNRCFDKLGTFLLPLPLNLLARTLSLEASEEWIEFMLTCLGFSILFGSLLAPYLFVLVPGWLYRFCLGLSICISSFVTLIFVRSVFCLDWWELFFLNTPLMFRDAIVYVPCVPCESRSMRFTFQEFVDSLLPRPLVYLCAAAVFILSSFVEGRSWLSRVGFCKLYPRPD